MNREELLAEARRKYPEGTEYWPISMFNNYTPEKTYKTSYEPIWWGGDGEAIHASIQGEFIYVEGKWAEIITNDSSVLIFN